MGTEHHPGFHIQEPGSAILDLELGEGHGGAYSGVAVTRAGLPSQMGWASRVGSSWRDSGGLGTAPACITDQHGTSAQCLA